MIKEHVASSVKHTRFAMSLSLTAGFFLLILKMYAYAITGSTAILSDAAESIVHIFAVMFAAYSLWLSQKPADHDHMYGHDRISFFSAGFEGAMIILAASYIIYEAIVRLISGLHLENVDIGTLFIAAAAAINGVLGWYLVRQGKKYHSLILEANGKHVLTDSCTSFGVVVALILTTLTGWLPLDPIVAILVALNILLTGGKLIRRSIVGLMDQADPDVSAQLVEILQRETKKYNIEFHHLRHRNAGNRVLVEFHLLFNQITPLVVAHEVATQIEREIHTSLPFQLDIISHLEPMEGHDVTHEKMLNEKHP